MVHLQRLGMRSQDEANEASVKSRVIMLETSSFGFLQILWKNLQGELLHSRSGTAWYFTPVSLLGVQEKVLEGLKMTARQERPKLINGPLPGPQHKGCHGVSNSVCLLEVIRNVQELVGLEDPGSIGQSVDESSP